jgi:translation initiation factor 1
MKWFYMLSARTDIPVFPATFPQFTGCVGVKLYVQVIPVKNALLLGKYQPALPNFHGGQYQTRYTLTMRTKQDKGNGGIVYSTEHGRMCPNCSAPLEKCLCHQKTQVPTEGIVRIRKETKGRKGSTVTVITGIPLHDPELTEFCTRLKKRCGSGGTVKDGAIEIQGDHGTLLREELSKHGWKVQLLGR